MNFRLAGFILISCCVLLNAKYYPAEYDLRFEPDYRNCNFKVSEEGLCSANWAVIISEVLSNMYCLKQQKTTLLLSKQHLLDCAENAITNLEKCQYFGNTDVFYNALEYVQTKGITTDACYPFTSIITGDENDCSSKCADGSTISELYKATYTNLTSIEQVKDFLLYQGPVITMIDAYDDLLHYSMQDNVDDQTGSSTYDADLGYRTLKIVGWMTENATEYWVAGNSWGQNWAVTGYMYLETSNAYIISYHGLQLP